MLLILFLIKNNFNTEIYKILKEYPNKKILIINTGQTKYSLLFLHKNKAL